jgi:hypothetical protein
MNPMLLAVGIVFMMASIPLLLIGIMLKSSRIRKNSVIGVRFIGYEKWSDDKWKIVNASAGKWCITISVAMDLLGFAMIVLGVFFLKVDNISVGIVTAAGFIVLVMVLAMTFSARNLADSIE